MATLDDYKAGSYRSIPFFYRGTSEPGGFNAVQHAYPGSNNFQVEQLGRQPRRFNMDVGVRTEDGRRFDNALKTSGTGVLVHPVEGRFLVKLTTFTKDDRVTQLGLIDYQVTFIVEIGLQIPTVQGISLSLINTLSSELITKAAANGKERLKKLGF